MSEPRADDSFEIPIERLAEGRGQRRRAAIAVASLAIVVGGAIGLARLAADGRGRASVVVSAEPVTGLIGPSASASGELVATPRPSGGARVEQLLDVPDRALSAAPQVLLVEQAELDIRLVEWTPGAGLRAVGTVRGAIEPRYPDVIPVVAPTDDRILLFEPGRADQPGGDRARLVDAAGRALWTGDDLAARSGAVWSTDGRMIVIAGSGRRWHLISIGARGVATDDVVQLPFAVFLPSPLPRGWLTIPRVDPRTIPLGFSADGRWVYGGVVSPELGILIATFRVAIDGSVAEPVADLGVRRPDGLAPQPGTLGGRLVDPTTGRIATLRSNADTSGGPPTLEIRNPDAGLAFTVHGTTPLGSGWDSDGGLDVLSADAPLFPERVVLERIGPDGTAGPPIVETGPITGADFLGIRDGHAAIAVSVTRPSRATQIILVDLADRTRITAITLPMNGPASILAVELRT